MDNDKCFCAYLKAARVSAKISVSEISSHLTALGYKASEKTIYSWESGRSQPTPDALLDMCKFYGVQDVLSTFGYEKFPAPAEQETKERWQGLYSSFEKLNETGQNRLAEYAGFLISKDEYRKDSLHPIGNKDSGQKLVETVQVFQAARSSNNAPPEWVNMSKEELDSIFSAPESETDI